MKLYCRFVVRRLALTAVRGDDPGVGRGLSNHLQACASCRGVWEELQKLHEDLGQTIPCAEVNPDFIRSVSQRIAAAPAERPAAFRLTASALAAVLGISLLTLGVRYADSLYQGRKLPAMAHRPTETVAAKSAAMHLTHSLSPVVKRSQAPAPALHRHRKRAGPRPPLVPPLGRTYLATNSPKKERPKTTWAAVGLYFEFAGDYRRASAAYALAYKQKPATALAYATARSAESAGDIDRALDYYAAVLDASPVQKQ